MNGGDGGEAEDAGDAEGVRRLSIELLFVTGGAESGAVD